MKKGRTMLALITCNSCDAIDGFSQSNTAGYCRECWSGCQTADKHIEEWDRDYIKGNDDA